MDTLTVSQHVYLALLTAFAANPAISDSPEELAKRVERHLAACVERFPSE